MAKFPPFHRRLYVVKVKTEGFSKAQAESNVQGLLNLGIGESNYYPDETLPYVVASKTKRRGRK